MDVTSITAKTHRLTKTDTNTYTDADILLDLNQLQKEMGVFILKVQGYREEGENKVTTNLVSTTGLTAGQLGYDGEYPFPTDFLRLKRLEVKFSGQDSTPTTLYDSSTNIHSEKENVSDAFDKSKPYIKFGRGSFFIRPLPTTSVTGGIYIEYEQRHADLSGGSDIPVLESDFHRIYPLLLAKEYSQENPEKYNSLWDVEIKTLKAEIANFYRKRFNYIKEITTKHESYK